MVKLRKAFTRLISSFVLLCPKLLYHPHLGLKFSLHQFILGISFQQPFFHLKLHLNFYFSLFLPMTICLFLDVSAIQIFLLPLLTICLQDLPLTFILVPLLTTTGIVVLISSLNVLSSLGIACLMKIIFHLFISFYHRSFWVWSFFIPWWFVSHLSNSSCYGYSHEWYFFRWSYWSPYIRILISIFIFSSNPSPSPQSSYGYLISYMIHLIQTNMQSLYDQWRFSNFQIYCSSSLWSPLEICQGLFLAFLYPKTGPFIS